MSVETVEALLKKKATRAIIGETIVVHKTRDEGCSELACDSRVMEKLLTRFEGAPRGAGSQAVEAPFMVLRCR